MLLFYQQIAMWKMWESVLSRETMFKKRITHASVKVFIQLNKRLALNQQWRHKWFVCSQHCCQTLRPHLISNTNTFFGYKNCCDFINTDMSLEFGKIKLESVDEWNGHKTQSEWNHSAVIRSDKRKMKNNANRDWITQRKESESVSVHLRLYVYLHNLYMLE